MSTDAAGRLRVERDLPWALPEQRVVKPRYWRQDHPAWDEHPLIAALRPLPDDQLLPDLVGAYPRFDPADLDLPRRVRRNQAEAVLGQTRLLLPMHLEALDRVDMLLRLGYLGARRNPLLGAAFWHEAGGAARQVAAAATQRPVLETVHATSLVGDSGMGKSTLVRMILRLYPRLIIHQEWRGRRFEFQQVPWLLLDCNNMGSVKAFCQAFFMELDTILGNEAGHYYRHDARAGRASVDTMMTLMGLRALQHGLGVLVIDHLELLAKLKGDHGETFLDFIAALVNILHLPVWFIGSPDIEPLMGQRFRSSRRLSDGGYLPWTRFPSAADPGFVEAMDAIRPYTYTRVPLGDWDAILRTMYAESQGLLGVITTLWWQVQHHVISTARQDADEQVTPEKITHVARHALRLLQPTLGALRTGVATDLRTVSDIWTRQPAPTPLALPPQAQPGPATAAAASAPVTMPPAAGGTLSGPAAETQRGRAPQRRSSGQVHPPLDAELKQYTGRSNAAGWSLLENALAVAFLTARREKVAVHDTLVSAGFIRKWTLDEIEFGV